MEKENTKDLKDYAGRIQQLVENFQSNIHEHLNEDYEKSTKWSDKLADSVAEFVGSWKFINIFVVFLVAWVILNTLAITKVIHFDEPPFILLNLLLSFLAGFQAPIIMMSQNRQSARDKQEATIDFAINYKAEQEIDDMQGHLHRLEADFAEFRNEVKEDLTEIKKLLQGK
ncbi:DUF1003 domain-containing protein [Paenibacillus frigoriresistens]|uniref:DUF1003 domain-containing protein n=1 Tax=Paenibacillus alginolyticus TaxID=59839 RepID=UPI0015648A81|nr:DUF1003 domain-containing protein [Paenibacillus frigoriresistens]NRF95679.1 DUF1003 domain-containing protein [Paenibacillus frigoriresistens]